MDEKEKYYMVHKHSGEILCKYFVDAVAFEMNKSSFILYHSMRTDRIYTPSKS